MFVFVLHTAQIWSTWWEEVSISFSILSSLSLVKHSILFFVYKNSFFLFSCCCFSCILHLSNVDYLFFLFSCLHILIVPYSRSSVTVNGIFCHCRFVFVVCRFLWVVLVSVWILVYVFASALLLFFFLLLWYFLITISTLNFSIFCLFSSHISLYLSYSIFSCFALSWGSHSISHIRKAAGEMFLTSLFHFSLSLSSQIWCFCIYTYMRAKWQQIPIIMLYIYKIQSETRNTRIHPWKCLPFQPSTTTIKHPSRTL